MWLPLQDGGIDASELAAALKKLGVALTSEQLISFRDDLLAEAESGGGGNSGSLSLGDFTAAIASRKPMRGGGGAPGSAQAAWNAVSVGRGIYMHYICIKNMHMHMLTQLFLRNTRAPCAWDRCVLDVLVSLTPCASA